MNLKSVMSDLGVSKWQVVWAWLTGGWADLAKIICENLTKLLQKADPEKLKKYSTLAAKLAVFLRGIIETFVEDELVRDAALKTADAVAVLAEHLADGEYKTEELDADIDNIRVCVDAWEKVAKRK